MDAQTYHDLHCTLVRLEKVISHARYQDKRTGIIPPQAMGDVLNEMGDAMATISALTNETPIAKHMMRRRWK